MDAYAAIAELLHKSQVSHLGVARVGASHSRPTQQRRGACMWSNAGPYPFKIQGPPGRVPLRRWASWVVKAMPGLVRVGGHLRTSHSCRPCSAAHDFKRPKCRYLVRRCPSSRPLPTQPTPAPSQIVDLLSKQFSYVDGRRWDLLRTEIFAPVRKERGGKEGERERRDIKGVGEIYFQSVEKSAAKPARSREGGRRGLVASGLFLQGGST